MKLYLDEDSGDPVLARLLSNAGHEVTRAIDVGMIRKPDPVHFAYAAEHGLSCLTGDHDDYLVLHSLVMCTKGHHPGILVVRRDNDPRRDMTPRGIVRAIGNLVASGAELADSFYVLNQWR